MRTIQSTEITQAVKDLFIQANFDIGDSVFKTLEDSMNKEKSQLGKSILEKIYENNTLAKKEGIAICQDTGMSVVFIDIGQDVHIEGTYINDAIHEGVRQAYQEGYLRKSVVKDPLFERVNTKDNTPAVIHTTIIPGDKVHIEVMPKGFGSENMSTLKMFAPSVGIEGVKQFILDAVEKAGPNACPPMIVGVGIGGTFEYASLIAKKAVLRGTDHPHPDPRYRELEEELLTKINKTGIGPAGLGGLTTAFALNIEVYPTHIASIPVAINISCHASRHASIEL
ncbi:MAG TPA: fumarate hydratase [Erysipelotrichaceae bacterium]|nr:fumarate hydratase [Erysipelotrichaceae bacterium]